MNVAVVGVGGIGSFVAVTLSKMLVSTQDRVHLFDGDKVEDKNLGRQVFFSKADVGKPKTTVLAKRFSRYKGQLVPHAEYFKNTPKQKELLAAAQCVFCCVDNNPARNLCLSLAETGNKIVIVGANEIFDSEAYVLRPEWVWKSELDPRLYYPVLVADTSNDPTRPNSCMNSGEQTTSANLIAAGMMIHLFQLWCVRLPPLLNAQKLTEADVARFPHRINSTWGRLWATAQKEADISEDNTATR